MRDTRLTIGLLAGVYPPMASMPSAAAIARGTAITPSRLAFATDGAPPADLAARSHSTHASDPVTNKFGPMLSPIRRANGCGGVRAARSDAAGRLFTSTLVPAATT